jgi:hypothetical protein
MPEACDKGQPYVLSDERNDLKDAFEEVVKRLVEAVEENKLRDAGAA